MNRKNKKALIYFFVKNDEDEICKIVFDKVGGFGYNETIISRRTIASPAKFLSTWGT